MHTLFKHSHIFNLFSINNDDENLIQNHFHDIIKGYDPESAGTARAVGKLYLSWLLTKVQTLSKPCSNAAVAVNLKIGVKTKKWVDSNCFLLFFRSLWAFLKTNNNPS